MLWNIQFMDTDYHRVIQNGVQINLDSEIMIGSHIWINSYVIILKGTAIPDGSVVTTGALLNKKYMESKSALGGIPARILKKGITWNE
jgi:acetyltransferase-like isoleucine patch superfamily enzyme